MAAIEFSKLHGTANDFVYVEARRGLPGDPVRSRPASATGIAGSAPTGSSCSCPSENRDCRMRIYNSDGSTAEMCGNGIRGFAKFVPRRGTSCAGTRSAVETGRRA
jgi:diaminopimelate epimerase